MLLKPNLAALALSQGSTGLGLRRSLNQWFDRNGIVPRVIAELEDSALLEVFGSDGTGVFPGPSVVQTQIASPARGRTRRASDRA